MTARVGPRLAPHLAAIAAFTAGCADEGVDLVTREEGCAGYDIGPRLKSRLIDAILLDEVDPEPWALQEPELRDEEAVLEWYLALGLGWGSELPSDWELPDFRSEMCVPVTFLQYDVVQGAKRRGVIGFYEDMGPADRIVALIELEPECQYSDYNPYVVALHAVPIGNIKSCSFGNPEECCSYLDRDEC